MDMDEENNVVLLKEVKPKKLVKWVMGNAEERDINGKTSSIPKTQRETHVRR